MATMSDVAKMAGYSLYTVSKVVNGNTSVKKATRERVLAACEELGYERNLYAVNLVSKTSNTIGMIVSQIVNPFYGEIIEAAEKEAARLGYQLVYRCSYMDAATEAAALRHFLSLKVCGIILSPVITDENRDLLAQLDKRLPLVYIDRYFADASHHVVNDNYESAALVTSHLLEQGIQPAYLGSFHGILNRAFLDRERGYRAAMETAGLEPLLIPGHRNGHIDNEDYGYASVTAYLKEHAAPSGLFCATDSIAIGAMRAFEEKNLRVGRDILLAGHDDLPYSAFLNPPLTTVSQPKQAMGEEAINAVTHLLEADAHGPVQQTLHSQLRIRASSQRSG